MNGIPESREVWEHGEREFDRVDAELSRINRFVVGVVVGFVLASVLWLVF